MRVVHHQAEGEQDVELYNDNVASSSLAISKSWVVRVLLRARSSAPGARVLQRPSHRVGGNGSDMGNGVGTDVRTYLPFKAKARWVTCCSIGLCMAREFEALWAKVERG